MEVVFDAVVVVALVVAWLFLIFFLFFNLLCCYIDVVVCFLLILNKKINLHTGKKKINDDDILFRIVFEVFKKHKQRS